MSQPGNNILKQKVLMVAMFPPPFSSGERQVNYNIKNILEEDFYVDSFNVSTGKLNPSKRSFSKILNQAFSFYLYIKAYLFILKKLRTNEYTSFLFVTPSSSFGHIRDWVMLLVIKKRIKHIYAFIHNGDYDKIFKAKWHSRITNSFIQRIYKFIFLSEGLQRNVSPSIPKEKSLVIHNTIDAALYCTDIEVKDKIDNFKRSEINIIYASNMNPSKGYMDAANAINILSKSKPELKIRIDFIGEWLSKKQEDEFETFIKSNELETIIYKHGRINDRKVIKEYLLKSNVFILPTYFAYEAQPLSILEALNAGCAIITTRHASIPEYITDGCNGFLVEKKSPSSIVQAIEKLYDIDALKNMAANARKGFVTNFSPVVYKEKLFSLIKQPQD